MAESNEAESPYTTWKACSFKAINYYEEVDISPN